MGRTRFDRADPHLMAGVAGQYLDIGTAGRVLAGVPQ